MRWMTVPCVAFALTLAACTPKPGQLATPSAESNSSSSSAVSAPDNTSALLLTKEELLALRTGSDRPKLWYQNYQDSPPESSIPPYRDVQPVECYSALAITNQLDYGKQLSEYQGRWFGGTEVEGYSIFESVALYSDDNAALIAFRKNIEILQNCGSRSGGFRRYNSIPTSSPQLFIINLDKVTDTSAQWSLTENYGPKPEDVQDRTRIRLEVVKNALLRAYVADLSDSEELSDAVMHEMHTRVNAMR